MELISIFLLLGPGILMWKLESGGNLSDCEMICKMILKTIFYNFVVLICSYLILTCLEGYIYVNFSSDYIESMPNSIFNIGFVWKYAVLSCAVAVLGAFGIRLYRGIKAKRSIK